MNNAKSKLTRGRQSQTPGGRSGRNVVLVFFPILFYHSSLFAAAAAEAKIKICSYEKFPTLGL